MRANFFKLNYIENCWYTYTYMSLKSNPHATFSSTVGKWFRTPILDIALHVHGRGREGSSKNYTRNCCFFLLIKWSLRLTICFSHVPKDKSSIIYKVVISGQYFALITLYSMFFNYRATIFYVFDSTLNYEGEVNK